MHHSEKNAELSAMNDTVHSLKETWQPLPHVAPAGFRNSALFYLRLFLDMNVFTTYKDVKKYLFSTHTSVLEVGCGLKPYRYLVPEGVKYCAIDWEGAGSHFHYNDTETIYYNGDTFPVKDSSFEYLFHTEVLEHVYDLEHFLRECCRVLSGRGKMFFTIPFAARYHYIPYDYWRLTPAAIEKLLVESGFTHVLVKPRGSDIIVAVTKTKTLFVRAMMRSIGNPILRAINRFILGILFLIPLFSFALMEHLFLFFNIGSADDPLGYSVYCEKKMVQE
jgi:SAM-dependent methyltransferase